MSEYENKAKIRFKFRSGEEFEAEGSPAFIAQQRADFLQLIGKANLTSLPAPAATQTAPKPQPQPTENPFTTPLEEMPAALRRPPAPSVSDLPATRPISGAAHPSARLWEEIAKSEGEMVFLRRKSRQLTAAQAVLLLLGAAKALAGQTAYSALALAKSLKKSGYTDAGRLDRILGAELKQGTIISTGSKRSRNYSLSTEGAARAFVLAQKLIEGSL